MLHVYATCGHRFISVAGSAGYNPGVTSSALLCADHVCMVSDLQMFEVLKGLSERVKAPTLSLKSSSGPSRQTMTSLRASSSAAAADTPVWMNGVGALSQTEITEANAAVDSLCTCGALLICLRLRVVIRLSHDDVDVLVTCCIRAVPSSYLQELRAVFARLPIAVIPGGTSNGFASAVSSWHPFEAVRAVVCGRPRTVVGIELWSWCAARVSDP